LAAEVADPQFGGVAVEVHRVHLRLIQVRGPLVLEGLLAHGHEAFLVSGPG